MVGINMKWFGQSKKKETEDYEKEYLDRLKKQPEDISKKKTSKHSTEKIETGSTNDKLKVQDNESTVKNMESVSEKLQLVKEEYNQVIGNLMHAKKEQKSVIDKVQKSNNEYDDLISKIKLVQADLLKLNNEFREKNENLSKITEEYKKHSLVIQEINNSKKEVVELKAEIKKYNDELESVKVKAGSFPEINKMREEKKKLENEIVQKRKEIESGIKELKFIQNQIANVGKNKESTNVVDAASAVVASMKQKLQNTQKELDLVREALEQERKTKNK